MFYSFYKWQLLYCMPLSIIGFAVVSTQPMLAAQQETPSLATAYSQMPEEIRENPTRAAQYLHANGIHANLFERVLNKDTVSAKSDLIANRHYMALSELKNADLSKNEFAKTIPWMEKVLPELQAVEAAKTQRPVPASPHQQFISGLNTQQSPSILNFESSEKKTSLSDIYSAMPIGFKIEREISYPDAAKHFKRHGVSVRDLKVALEHDKNEIKNYTVPEQQMMPFGYLANTYAGKQRIEKDIRWMENVLPELQALESPEPQAPGHGPSSQQLDIQQSLPSVSLNIEPAKVTLQQAFANMKFIAHHSPIKAARHFRDNNISAKTIEDALRADEAAAKSIGTDDGKALSCLTGEFESKFGFVLSNGRMKKVLPELRKLEGSESPPSEPGSKSEEDSDTKKPGTKPVSTCAGRFSAIPTPVLVGGGLLLFALTLYALKRAYECVYAAKPSQTTEDVSEKDQSKPAETTGELE